MTFPSTKTSINSIFADPSDDLICASSEVHSPRLSPATEQTQDLTYVQSGSLGDLFDNPFADPDLSLDAHSSTLDDSADVPAQTDDTIDVLSFLLPAEDRDEQEPISEAIAPENVAHDLELESIEALRDEHSLLTELDAPVDQESLVQESAQPFQETDPGIESLIFDADSGESVPVEPVDNIFDHIEPTLPPAEHTENVDGPSEIEKWIAEYEVSAHDAIFPPLPNIEGLDLPSIDPPNETNVATFNEERLNSVQDPREILSSECVSTVLEMPEEDVSNCTSNEPQDTSNINISQPAPGLQCFSEDDSSSGRPRKRARVEQTGNADVDHNTSAGQVDEPRGEAIPDSPTARGDNGDKPCGVGEISVAPAVQDDSADSANSPAQEQSDSEAFSNLLSDGLPMAVASFDYATEQGHTFGLLDGPPVTENPIDFTHVPNHTLGLFPDAPVVRPPETRKRKRASNPARSYEPPPPGCLTCPECKHKFKRRKELTRHMRLYHTGPYECDACGARLTTAEGLRRHGHVHGAEQPHVCAHCAVRFSSMGGLRAHLKRMHDEVLPLARNRGRSDYGKSTAPTPASGPVPERSDLQSAGPEPATAPEPSAPAEPAAGGMSKAAPYMEIMCPVKGCTKEMRKSSLKRHIRVVHERERRFECEKCGRQFSSSYNKHLHQRRMH